MIWLAIFFVSANGNRIYKLSGRSNYVGIIDSADRLRVGRCRAILEDAGQEEIQRRDGLGGINAAAAARGENRRVGKEIGGTLTTGFLYQDGLNVVAQLDGGGNPVA